LLSVRRAIHREMAGLPPPATTATPQGSSPGAAKKAGAAPPELAGGGGDPASAPSPALPPVPFYQHPDDLVRTLSFLHAFIKLVDKASQVGGWGVGVGGCVGG
jgi:hypothetical protein